MALRQLRILGHYRLLPHLDCGLWGTSVSSGDSIVSISLRPHGLQHSRLPCPSSTPEAYSNSCTSSRWCHPTISSSVIPSSYCLQSFPVSGSFPMSKFSHQVAKVLELQQQHQSFQWIFRTDFLLNWLVGSPCRWGTCPAFNEGLNSSPPKKWTVSVADHFCMQILS